MERIVKKDGYVYSVIEHDVYGMHKTIRNLGKDPDDPMWADDLKKIIKPKPKKKTKKEEDK